MPELPEVQTVCDYLHPKLINKTILSVNSFKHAPNALVGIDTKKLESKLKNVKITSVFRRAKYVILELSNKHFLAFHLRMTGRLMFDVLESERKYLSLELLLNDNLKLYFKDVRRFGKIYYFDSMDYLDSKLGIEPLSDTLTFELFFKMLQTKTKRIKPLLLDQSFVVGIGNIYADEVLYISKIHPTRKANQISKKEARVLLKAIKETLRKSIKLNGTTFINFYYERNQNGAEKSGDFAKMLKVFGKNGLPCSRKDCSSIIKKEKMFSRGTHFCEICQV